MVPHLVNLMDYVSVSHLDYMTYTENQSGAVLLYSLCIHTHTYI